MQFAENKNSFREMNYNFNDSGTHMIPHIILCAYFEGYNISAVYNVYRRNFRKEAKAYRGNKSIFGQIIVVENCGIIQKSFDICCIFSFWIWIEVLNLPIIEL